MSMMRTWRSALQSISRGEALAHVLGFLDLVDDGDGEVLAADAALAFGILDQAVEAETELAGALAGRNRGGPRERPPAENLALAGLLVGFQRPHLARRPPRPLRPAAPLGTPPHPP